jgi:hypothetical protein
MTELHDAIGSSTALHPDEKNTLMHRFSTPKTKLIIDGDIPPSLSMASKAHSLHQAQKQSSQLVSSVNSPSEQYQTWNLPTSPN